MNDALNKQQANRLLDQQCRDYASHEPALAPAEIKKLLLLAPSWQYDQQTPHIYRKFRFDDYQATIAFVNKVAQIAQREDHHPQLTVSYNQCSVSYQTHSVSGLTENDFICAAKINQLYPGVNNRADL